MASDQCISYRLIKVEIKVTPILAIDIPSRHAFIGAH